MIMERLIYSPDGKGVEEYINNVVEEIGLGEFSLERKLDEHLNWCIKHVPMYFGVSADSDALGIDALKQFPIFDKKNYRTPTPETRSILRFKGERVDGTSGTSGLSFQFITTENERAVRKAYELLANDIIGLGPGKRHLVIWGGHEKLSTMSNSFKTFVINKLSGRQLIIVSGPDKKSLGAAVRAVFEHADGVLITYPSLLRGLLEFPDVLTVLKGYKSIILTGEAIPSDLYTDFGLKNLKNRYGSREFGAIGVGEGAELGFFGNRFVVEHDEDRGMLITDLEKKCMPMLRYPIGDFSNRSVNSENGLIRVGNIQLPLLGEVSGRVFDVLIGKSGRKFIGTFWTIYLKKIGISKFRLIQTRPDEVTLLYVGLDTIEKLKLKFERDLLDEFNWIFRKVEDIPELKNAKQKIVEKNCD